MEAAEAQSQWEWNKRLGTIFRSRDDSQERDGVEALGGHEMHVGTCVQSAAMV